MSYLCMIDAKYGIVYIQKGEILKQHIVSTVICSYRQAQAQIKNIITLTILFNILKYTNFKLFYNN